MLWILYDDFKQTLMEIKNQVDIIRFGNRDGFFVLGIGFPLLHLLNITGSFLPDFIKKYQKSLNYCVIGLVIVLLTVGFAISSWLQSRAENAGYIHCRYVSGVSALAKTLVYTKEAQICMDLEAKARAERKRR
jgi:tetrahydromethanopterin S-methyltransferase subunit E